MTNFLRLAFTVLFCTSIGLTTYADSPGSSDESSLDAVFKSGIHSDNDTKVVIKAILSVIGLKPNFEIKPANVPNATAIIKEGKRYILYNPSFISSINNSAHTNWGAISILAHEIGHHLNGHTLVRGGSNHKVELECDEFSGFILRKMGATLKESQAVVNVFCSDREFPTHPCKKARLKAIKKGWDRADSQIALLGTIIKEASQEDSL